MTYAEFIEVFGYIVAPLLKGTCEWFVQKAKYPVKLSLRSSEPFVKVAEQLVKLNCDKYSAMQNWSGIFINRDISLRLKEPNITLYCDKNGLNKKYTMCDIGYSDKIFKNMLGSGYQPTEFLQMFAANGINYFDDHIRRVYPYNFDFFVNFSFDEEHLCIKFDEFFSHYIMHFLPKTHKKYNDAACAEFDNSGEPILLDNKNPFVEPFYKGIYQSLKDNILTEQDTIHFFCTEDLPWLQRALLMTHNNYDQSPWKYFNLQDSITEPSKTLSKLSDYYNNMKSLEKKSV